MAVVELLLSQCTFPNTNKEKFTKRLQERAKAAQVLPTYYTNKYYWFIEQK